MDEKVSELINATGALAEMLGVFKRNLQGNGFTDSECVYLCGSMLRSIISNARNTGKSED